MGHRGKVILIGTVIISLHPFEIPDLGCPPIQSTIQLRNTEREWQSFADIVWNGDIHLALQDADGNNVGTL
jgi:hypothetical protein